MMTVATLVTPTPVSPSLLKKKERKETEYTAGF